MTGAVKYRPAVSPADFDSFGALIEEYVAWLGLDLGYQGLDSELQDLADLYGPPDGFVLLAERMGSDVLGGLAVKPLPQLTAKTCEMKRLYVRPAGRGIGIAHRLVGDAMHRAAIIGYRRMVLDTLPSRMPEAVSLYRSLGFVECAPYYDTPIAETMFLEVELSRLRSGQF